MREMVEISFDMPKEIQRSRFKYSDEELAKYKTHKRVKDMSIIAKYIPYKRVKDMSIMEKYGK